MRVLKDFVIPDEKGNVICTLRCNFDSEVHVHMLDSRKIEITRGTDTTGMIVQGNILKKKTRFKWF